MSAGHTPGPWLVKVEGTLTGAWATVYEQCVDPNTGKDWDRELFRSETTHVRKEATYEMQSGWGELHETPDQWELADDGNEHLANARLIAAAPDLLENLQALVILASALESRFSAASPFRGAMQSARVAIAKATQP